jgi:uncharacterized peroxidase-related enzyme
MPFINTIPYEDSENKLREIYDDVLKKRGKLAEVIKIQSLSPQSIVDHMNLYMTIMFGKSPLKRAQREMIAVVVSIANNCEYCKTHHSEALNHFWKDEVRLKQFEDDYHTANLTISEIAICDYAKTLTLNPSEKRDMYINTLKEQGLDDRSILDLNLIVSYFNFVNRMVLGLGVNLESDGGKNYSYD